MELSILYEDNDIVAIDKPSGVMTHPDGRGGPKDADGVDTEAAETASDWFAAHYPASKEVGETQRLSDGTELRRPGVVHRLDRETSGVLVFAKTPEAHEFLKEAFKNREVKKTYLAFVYGAPKEEKGIIEFAIGRSRKDFRLRSAQPKAKGIMREAVTRYRVVGSTKTHSLLKAMPETGRTHQIRVHLKAIHHPVVCDPLYSPKMPCDLGFKRLGLHAFELDLPLQNGERKVIVSKPPADLLSAIKGFPGTAELLKQIEGI